MADKLRSFLKTHVLYTLRMGQPVGEAWDGGGGSHVGTIRHVHLDEA